MIPQIPRVELMMIVEHAFFKGDNPNIKVQGPRCAELLQLVEGFTG
jgi:hypothetical protein